MTIATIMNILTKKHLVEDLGFQKPDPNDLVMGNTGTWYFEPIGEVGKILVMFTDRAEWSVTWRFGDGGNNVTVRNVRQLHRALKDACRELNLPKLSAVLADMKVAREFR